MLLLAPDTIVTTGAGGVQVTRPIIDAYPGGGSYGAPSIPALPGPSTGYTVSGPLTIITEPVSNFTPPGPTYQPPIPPIDGGTPLPIPTPVNNPAAPPGNATLTNQTYQCGGRCGATPLPSPGGAGGTATTVTAAGAAFSGIPWWVWLVMALLVVLVLAKK